MHEEIRHVEVGMKGPMEQMPERNITTLDFELKQNSEAARVLMQTNF